MRYGPGGRFATRYTPSPSDFVGYWMLVASLTIKISAPATIPPEGSSTIPLIVPVGDCAQQTPARAKLKTRMSDLVRTRKSPPVANNLVSLLGLCELRAFLCHRHFCPGRWTDFPSLFGDYGWFGFTRR